MYWFSWDCIFLTVSSDMSTIDIGWINFEIPIDFVNKILPHKLKFQLECICNCFIILGILSSKFFACIVFWHLPISMPSMFIVSLSICMFKIFVSFVRHGPRKNRIDLSVLSLSPEGNYLWVTREPFYTVYQSIDWFKIVQKARTVVSELFYLMCVFAYIESIYITSISDSISP